MPNPTIVPPYVADVNVQNLRLEANPGVVVFFFTQRARWGNER
jgi:hypothetical protein